MSTRTGVLAARVFAVLVTVGVGAAAFFLSFATLRDLAKLAHIPAAEAWLFPLIVDGTIIQATLGWLVLAKSPERKFFVRVLIAGALISVAGNSIHAVDAGRSLPAWLCAVVAAIAPISLLVDTHGLAVLFRAAQADSTSDEAPALVANAAQSAPEPEGPLTSEPVEAPIPEPVTPVRPARPVPTPVRAVRPVRPVQQSLPIATS